MAAIGSEKNIYTKRKSYLWLVIASLVIINIAAYFFHAQIDLTKGKRYSITPATKSMLKNLDQDAFITVFLTGNDLPAAYKKLSLNTEELLKNFRDISGQKIQYRFADPLSNDSSVNKALTDFRMSGFPVTMANGKKGVEQKMVFPWALVVMNGKAWPVMLQESNASVLSRKILTKSEELLEYNMATAIHQLSKKSLDSVAYLTGNGETFGYEIFSALNYLGRYYVLDTINLQQHSSIPVNYKTIIINRPLISFSEQDKYKIDQFLMNGGSVYWGINAVNGALDSFRSHSQFNALPIDVNISDLLFHYGVRINPNLVLDADDNVDLPLPSSENDPNPQSYPWQYFPILHPPKDTEQPIVKNLNEILGKFVSSIDTISNDGSIKKTVLLTTSKYTKTESVPNPIMLAMATEPINRAEYNNPNRIAAILLEGSFHSAFQGHIPAEVTGLIDSLHTQLRLLAPKDAKMIVVSDGDLMMNEVNAKNGPMDMGMYAFSEYRFENRSFLLNCIEYLTDKNNLLAARTKSFEPQLLDAQRVSDERGKWQLINIAVPIAIVLIFAAVYLFVRKKRYA